MARSSSSNSPSEVYVDTLRISQRDWQRLVEDQQQSTMKPSSLSKGGADKRRSPRYTYTRISGLLVVMQHPGGSEGRYLVQPRNISRTGMGFLHGSFVHTGTRCKITLVDTSGDAANVLGEIVRVRHVQGKIHELGLRFDHPIDPENFIKDLPDPADNAGG